MISAIVTTKCKDFAAWKPAFEAHAEDRKKHGCSGCRVFQSVEDPNDLTIVFNWSSAEALGKFMADAEVQKKIASAGTIGKPVARLFNAAGSYAS